MVVATPRLKGAMDFEVRGDRRPQGRRKLAVERAEYLRPVNLGTGSETCRLLGVNDRTRCMDHERR
ncbi:hypothetical protein SLI_1612 [Streptomyces lividans 1326]|uniref:Uncharacterized protein n=1 Tax=Streptomyces lividans 1326 TaxID=1200984 RepID=A0A7U9H9U1_STRLI|nr:hypothetical protein SLI_1612 [Streptomyces lividans 1326]